MESCNNARIPAALAPLGTDNDGCSFNESLDYTTVVNMIMYLSKNQDLTLHILSISVIYLHIIQMVAMK